MYGFNKGGKPKAQDRRLMDGGMIEGPGTGTSDSIKAKIPRGSYIMPADSTEQIGPEALGKMGARGFGKFRDTLDARVSNGEYQLPPEQVHALGAQVLDQMKDATHAPVARGFQPQRRELFFADGGKVESTDEMIARISAKYGTSTAPAPQPAPRPQGMPQRPAPTPTIAGAADALRNRRQQLEAAGNYADGGVVDEEERARAIAGAPGVTRTGNSYSDASATPAPTPPAATPPASSSAAPAQSPAAPASQPNTPQRTPTFGETQNRINDQRAERVGGLYGSANQALGSAVRRAADAVIPNTTDAVMGGPERVSSAYRTGGLGAAAGQALRSAVSAPVGTVQDVARGFGAAKSAATSAIRPVVEGVATAGRTAFTGNAEPVRIADAAQPSGSDAYPDESRRGAATQTTAPNKPASQTKSTDASANTAPERAPFNAADLTQQERDTAGDAYRSAWQQQTAEQSDSQGNITRPGGLRRAGQNATALYNAEQQVRGTGITAQRDASGQMSFSGNGANALPQSYTQGVDLNAANASMASANAIRDSMLQGNGSGSPGGGAIADTGTADANATLARWGSESRSTGGRAGRADRALAIREQELAMNQDARSQELAARQQDQAATQDYRNRDLAMRGQETAARTGVEQERIGLARQQAEGEQQERGIRVRAAQRLEELQNQYQRAETPEQRTRLAEQIRALSGREESNRYTVVPGGQEWDAQAGVMRTNPSRVLNNQTGRFVDQPAATAQPAAPIDPAKFIKGKIYTDANGNRGIFDGTTFVPVS